MKRKLEKYRKEAGKKTPFELEADDGTVISIRKPSTKTVIELSKLGENPPMEDSLRLLCGNQYEALMQLVGDDDIDVLSGILNEMQQHFFGDRENLPTSPQPVS